jgi:hypothetical protein
MVTHSTVTRVDGDEYLIIEDSETGAVLEGYTVEVRP